MRKFTVNIEIPEFFFVSGEISDCLIDEEVSKSLREAFKTKLDRLYNTYLSKVNNFSKVNFEIDKELEKYKKDLDMLNDIATAINKIDGITIDVRRLP